MATKKLLKLQCEDESTKIMKYEVQTTANEIKEQFRVRFKPEDYKLFIPGDGRWIEDNATVASYGLESQAVVQLRKRPESGSSTVPQPLPPDAASSFTAPPPPPPPLPPLSTSGGDSARKSMAQGLRKMSKLFKVGGGDGQQLPISGPLSSSSGSGSLQPTKPADVDGDQDLHSRIQKIRNFLVGFIRKRPTAEELVVAKILPEKPAAQLVPPRLEPVRRVCDWLGAHAAEAEGLFRVSGPAAENKEIADSLVSGDIRFDKKTPAEVSPHSVSTALKIYFREKTETLIPYRAYKAYIDHVRSRPAGAEEQGQVEDCRALVSSMPDENREILVFLLRFLKSVTAHASANKMTTLNMAVVFGPTLMRPQVKGMDSLTECEAQIQLVHVFLNNIEQIETAPSAAAAAVAAAAAAAAPAAAPQVAEAPAPEQPCPWFINEQISPEAVQAKLKGRPAGTFAVTRCEPDKTCYEAFYVASHGEPMSFVVARTAEGWAKADDPFSFPSLSDLIHHYEDAGYFTNPFVDPSVSPPKPKLTRASATVGEIGAAVGPLISKDSDLPSKKKAAKDLGVLFETKGAATMEYLSTEVPNRQLVSMVMSLGRVSASI